jgi:putative DNA primase/helicase
MSSAPERLPTTRRTPLSELGRSALFYVRHLGWRVLPLKPKDKVPLGSCVPHGCKDASQDPEQVRSWWTAHPDANVGIATGAGSGIFVVDVDGAAGENALMGLQDQHEELPDTLVGLTGGGGRHLLFQHPGTSVGNKVALREHLDIRGDGGYIVAPPSVHPNGNSYAWDGKPTDPVATPPKWLLDLIGRPRERRSPQQHAEEARKIGAGEGRNHYLTKVGGTLRREGLDQDALREALQAVNATRCDPPLPDAEVGKIAWSLARYALPPEATKPPQQQAQQPGPASSGPRPPEGFLEHPLADAGNAERLLALYRARLRFCQESGHWLTWNGRTWERGQAAAQELAKNTGRQLLVAAAGIADDDRRKILIKWATQSMNEPRVRRMLALASSDPSVRVRIDQLDANPAALATPSGILELDIRELREPQPEDLVTLSTAARYRPGARLELWERFIYEATGGDAELAAFLQRAAGYSVSGDNSEEVLFFCYGPTAGGKSTFLEALKAALGSYAATADFEAFLERSHVGGPRPELARLRGKRFVASVEVDDGKKLASGLVKLLTGGDTICVRELYRSEFEFRPAFKLWLAANDPPNVRHEDAALWRRVLRVPFDHSVPPERRDPTVKATLRDPHQAGPAVLAWAVEGWRSYRERGLDVPESVRRCTDAYRTEMDPLRGFFEDCVFEGEGLWVASRELRGALDAWCAENRETPIRSGKTLARLLRGRGMKDRKVAGERGWEGLTLNDSGTALANRRAGTSEGLW